MEIRRTGEATFPSVTACPSYHSAYRRDYLASFGLTADDVRKVGLAPTNVSSGRRFHLEATFELEELVDRYEISTKYGVANGSRGSVFSPKGEELLAPDTIF